MHPETVCSWHFGPERISCTLGLYSADDRATLYDTRWEVETHLRHLKTAMHMDVLHGKTVAGVLKELTIFAIIDNLVRMVILPSAQLPRVDAARISFLDALRWFGASSTGLPVAALIINPARPHRVEPRVKKRRPKNFPFISKPRQELRIQLMQQALGASLHAIRVNPLLSTSVIMWGNRGRAIRTYRDVGHQSGQRPGTP